MFNAFAFLRIQVDTSSAPQPELAFVLSKTPVVAMRGMTVPKLELQAVLLVARLKQDISRAVTVNANRFITWIDRNTVLQWLNSTIKNPIFFANHFFEILDYTSVDKWNHVAPSDNPADTGTRFMSAEDLQSSS